MSNELIEKIDEIKEKISNKEYKDICDILLKHSKQKNNFYHVTIWYVNTELESLTEICDCQLCSEKMDEDEDYISVTENHIKYQLINKIKTITFTTKLKQCKCHFCTHMEGDCIYKDIYDGTGKIKDVFYHSLNDIFETLPFKVTEKNILYPYLTCKGRLQNLTICVNQDFYQISAVKMR